MRLSLSFKKNIMETSVGSIINRFKIRRRRNTFFFEKIVAEYIKEAEKHHKNKMYLIGQKWAALYFKAFVPSVMKKLPKNMLFNKIMIPIWVNLGLMDEAEFSYKDKTIVLRTKNETITREIGHNQTIAGYYLGIINSIFKRNSIIFKQKQTKEQCEYFFKLTDNPFDIDALKKTTYLKLNYIPKKEGLSFKYALSKGLFGLKGNNVYFRGLRIIPLENTIFHITSNDNISLDKLPAIAYSNFAVIVKKDTTIEEKLNLIKNILQFFGWGMIKIRFINENNITFNIQYPPHGLQKEGDNWMFLINCIQGFLWTINKNFRVKKFNSSINNLNVMYST